MILPALILLVPASLLARQAGPNASPAQESCLPVWAARQIRKNPRAKGFAVTPWLNPFFQRGDFDGDGKPDVAVLVRDRKSGKRGILILHRGGGAAQALGAGRAIGNGGDDLAWMDSWQVGEQQGRRESLILLSESGGGEVRWDGRAYRWRQRGD